VITSATSLDKQNLATMGSLGASLQIREYNDFAHDCVPSPFSARQHNAECTICYRPSIRPSICLSHWWMSQKRSKFG